MSTKLDLELYGLVTVQEAAYMYMRAASTIKYHVDKGNVKSRAVGHGNRTTYLISLASLVRYYQTPPLRLPPY